MLVNYIFLASYYLCILKRKYNYSAMKPAPKVNKSPYNPPPVKLRAQIIPEKVQKKKQSSSQSSSSDSDSSSYDSQVEDFANEFYDSAVKKADKSLQLKKDNQTKPQQKKNQEYGNPQNNEDSKIKNAQSELDKISAKLKYLKGNFNDFDMDAILFKKKDQKKLKQIAQFLSKKHKQKKDFMKKMKKIKNSEKQRKKIIEQMKQKKQEQEHNKKMKQIRKLSILIKQKMQKKKQDQQDKLEKIQEFYENFHKKYKNRKLYKLMEMSDKKKRNKELEEQNQILKQRRQYASQIISAEDIKDFKKRQQELLRDMEKVKQAEKDQKNAELAEKNRELRQKIYISNKYQDIQQEEIRREKLRQIPKEKLNKIKKYNSYVKQNFLPTKSRSQDDEDSQYKREQQNQEDETVQINGKLYRKIVKDRYLKGQKIGQITCTVPVPQTQRQMKLVGNSYLEQLKHLPKKRHSTSLDLTHKQQVKPKVATSRIQIPKMPKKLGKIILPKNPNRQQLENLIKSLKSKDQLISNQQHYLKVVHKHVNGSNPEKQALDQTLIDNIQKKINLLGRL